MLEVNMRRIALFSVLLCGTITGLFPLDLSAGGGFVLTPYQEGLKVSAPGYQTASIRNNWADWGIFGFFDAHYVEVDVGYHRAFFGTYGWYDFGSPLDMAMEYKNLDISYLSLGISLKYPLKIGGAVFAPLFGVSCWINLNADYGYENIRDAAEDPRKTEWDQWWIKVGFDIDYYVTPKVYLRFAAKLDFPLPTEEWENRESNVGSSFGRLIKDADANYFGVGGDFSLAVGYKIN
jgi:hypothetical protein